MHLRDSFRSSIQSILNHKMRSFLTLTGIVIGVLAVVTMFSSVYALKSLVKTNMEGMGWNYSLIITNSAGQNQAETPRRLRYKRTPENVKSLDYSDYLAIRSSIPHKMIYANVTNQAIYRIKNKDVEVTLTGTNSSFFTNKSYNLMSGRYFSKLEEDRGLPVIVLGYYFAEEQFGTASPLGRSITLSGNRYQVIGVLAKDKLNAGKGMDFNNWERQNDLKGVYIPVAYATQYLVTDHIVHFIYIQAQTEAGFDLLKTDVRQLLLARHSMYPNFDFQNIGDFLLKINAEIDENMKKWNITLFAIASISLIVGGIGLFSTLLISIQEKMLEIGVRKSLGATEGDIFFYFIFEAITLAILGALLGIMFAGLTLMAMTSALKFSLPLPIQGVAVGLFFSILVGFVAGLYPALKASGLDPIKAIYYFD